MSDTKLLFDEPPEEFFPDRGRPDPLVWVRRLVILPECSATVTPIREVEFRRGLNIITTAQPSERVDGPVGHNVGKTLLTRLIRYCLGEQHFAREGVRDAIRRALPDAWVVAEVVVDKTCWVVRRPIGASPPAESVCLEADHWHMAFGENVQRFSAFAEALQHVTTERFSHTFLPHRNRMVGWQDLLAWLTRDQYCRYRHPLQWRTSWTDSGTAELHDEDASVLIRLVMDLLDQNEAGLIRRHKQLLAELSQQRSLTKALEAELGTTKQFLQQRLHIDEELLTDDLFAEAARRRATMVREDIRKALDSLEDETGLQVAERALLEANEAVTKKEQEMNTRMADRTTAVGELDANRNASDSFLIASFGDLAIPCPLPAGVCPLKQSGNEPGKRDQLREFLVRQKTTDVQRLDQQVAELASQLKQLKTEAIAARAEFTRRNQQIAQAREQLHTRLWQTNGLLDEAEQFRQSEHRLRECRERLATLEQQVEDSRNAHHASHHLVATRQGNLNLHFNRVLRALMAAEPQGHIKIDMRGLHVVLDGRDSAPGEALTSEAALALDLACLSASVCGLGFLPRFVIHDSPREADLELHMYARLFDFVASLERSFADRLPSFQYIVTTTTPPPDEVRRKPFLRLTLDGRTTDGLLFRRRF